MRHNYQPQETPYTCGPASLKNCMLHYKVDVTESEVRKLCGTKKNEGTNEYQLEQAAISLGFKVRFIESKSPNVFKRKLSKGFSEGKVYIVSTEDHNHWISAVEYYNRKIKIVDSDYKKYVHKSILQYITFKQLLETSYCYNKFQKIKTCFALELEIDG